MKKLSIESKNSTLSLGQYLLVSSYQKIRAFSYQSAAEADLSADKY